MKPAKLIYTLSLSNWWTNCLNDTYRDVVVNVYNYSDYYDNKIEKNSHDFDASRYDHLICIGGIMSKGGTFDRSKVLQSFGFTLERVDLNESNLKFIKKLSSVFHIKGLLRQLKKMGAKRCVFMKDGRYYIPYAYHRNPEQFLQYYELQAKYRK